MDFCAECHTDNRAVGTVTLTFNGASYPMQDLGGGIYRSGRLQAPRFGTNTYRIHATDTYAATTGDLLTTTNDAGDVVQFTYDGLGRLKMQTNGRGFTTTYTFDGNDNLVQVDGPLGYRVRFVFDKNNTRTLRTLRCPSPNTNRARPNDAERRLHLMPVLRETPGQPPPLSWLPGDLRAVQAQPRDLHN